MTRFAMTVAMVVVLAGTAQAGPFGRKTVVRSSSATCTSDGCGTISTTERSRTVIRGNHSAQAVAETQAAECRCAHHGGNSGYEGVGCGSTPEQALRSCCSNGRAVIDQGVAQGRDGRWYACRRYSR